MDKYGWQSAVLGMGVGKVGYFNQSALPCDVTSLRVW
jgi:hypothetical protein